MRLDGKSALVTGGASGFGAEIAAVFAKEGAKVVIIDLNGEGAKAVAAGIGDRRARSGDVTRAEDIARSVTAATDLAGGSTSS